MPAEETGTASRNTHEYKNHGNGSLQIEKGRYIIIDTFHISYVKNFIFYIVHEFLYKKDEYGNACSIKSLYTGKFIIIIVLFHSR